ncbi:MAG: TOBE domain-containing protein [Candidatus Eremiobacteraeota bacterium]|nr:TOBE domain-containing protein [Candidatus Eremiobacteraeota bacterium]
MLPQSDGTLLGLRAEQLRLVVPDDPAARLEATASVAEHLGSQILLHASHAQLQLVVRLPADAEAPAAGTRIGLTFDTSAGVWFDQASGQRLDRSAVS